MVKLIVAVKRRADVSVETFHEHWRTTHARLVEASPATKRYVRRYVQCHTTAAEYARGEVAYDGTAELWFDSIEDKEAFFSDPDYLRHIQPDEGKFADMARTAAFLTEEEVVVGGARSA